MIEGVAVFGRSAARNAALLDLGRCAYGTGAAINAIATF